VAEISMRPIRAVNAFNDTGNSFQVVMEMDDDS